MERSSYGALTIANRNTEEDGEPMSLRQSLLYTGREVVRNGFLTTSLAGLGALGSVAGVIGLASPTAIGTIPRLLWLILLLATLAGCVALSFPQHDVTYTFGGGSWSIQLVVGDLFKQDYPVVVTADRRISIEPSEIGTDALISQLVHHWFDGDLGNLRAGLERPPLEADEQDLDVGTTVHFSGPSGARGWLICVSTKADGGTWTRWHELASSYESLWSSLRRENCSSAAVPVVGSGFARAQLPASGLLLLLVLSFHGACLEKSVARRLRVVVPEFQFDPRIFTETGKVLQYLGYRKT